MKYELLRRQVPPWPEPQNPSLVCLITVRILADTGNRGYQEISILVSQEDADRICSQQINTQVLETALATGRSLDDALEAAGYRT